MRKVIFFGAKPMAAKCLREMLGWLDVEIVGVVCRKHLDGNLWWHRMGGDRCIYVVEEFNLPHYEGVAANPLPRADIGISVLYDKVIPSTVLNWLQVLNLHSAPLPKYRGRNACAHAILNAERYYGVAAHWVTPELDMGNIVASSSFVIPESATSFELHETAMDHIFDIFVKTVPFIVARPAGHEGVEQKKHDGMYNDVHSLDGMRDLTGLIDDLSRFYRYVRAFDFPEMEPAYIRVGGRKIFLRTKI